MTTMMTIERFILQQQAKFPDATGTLTNMLYDIALAAKLIARETTRFGLTDIMGGSEHTNVHGERQQKLDLYADEVIRQITDYTGRLCAMASEEHEDIIVAITARDIEASDRLAKAHADQIVRQIQKLLSRDERQTIDL